MRKFGYFIYLYQKIIAFKMCQKEKSDERGNLLKNQLKQLKHLHCLKNSEV